MSRLRFLHRYYRFKQDPEEREASRTWRGTFALVWRRMAPWEKMLFLVLSCVALWRFFTSTRAAAAVAAREHRHTALALAPREPAAVLTRHHSARVTFQVQPAARAPCPGADYLASGHVPGPAAFQHHGY